MYNLGGKLLCGIKSMYVDSLACVKVKGGRVSGSCLLSFSMYIWMQW